MAKPIVGTLKVTYPNTLIGVDGTNVTQDAEAGTISMDVKIGRKTERRMFSTLSLDTVLVTGEEASVYFFGPLTETYEDVTLESTADGFFSGTKEDQSILIKPGLWSFALADAEAVAEKPAKGAKAKPAKEEAAEKPAAKGKKAAEPEPEVEEEEFWPEDGASVTFTDEDGTEVSGEVTNVTAKSFKVDGTKYLKASITDMAAAEASEEEAEGEDYEPEVEEVVTIKQEGEDDVTGTVEKINAKSITVDGVKYIRADITIEAGTSEPEFVPQLGSYVTLTLEDESEVTGEVTKLTAKSITVKDEDDDETKHVLADVTVVEAEKPKPKKAAGKAKAAPVADEDDAPVKPAKKGIKAAKAEPEEEDEAPAKGKAAAKAPAKGKAAADSDEDWPD